MAANSRLVSSWVRNEMVVFMGETLTYRRAKRADRNERGNANGGCMDDFTEREFTRVEAEMKKGIKVCVIVDRAFSDDDLVKGTTGKVFDAKPSSVLGSAGSPHAPDPNRD